MPRKANQESRYPEYSSVINVELPVSALTKISTKIRARMRRMHPEATIPPHTDVLSIILKIFCMELRRYSICGGGSGFLWAGPWRFISQSGR